MPTQVQNRPSSADPLPSSRVGVDKFPPVIQQDHAHHPSGDPRARISLQHREALRLALGSILTPKRPSLSPSRSSSGTASPALSGSSGTYTPATPPNPPYTPSLDPNALQEHLYNRHYYSHPHHYPTHPPSKLGRVESHTDVPETGNQPPAPQAPSSPPLIQLQPPTPNWGPPHPLIRTRSSNPSAPPSSRTSPRLQPTSPPLPAAPIPAADCLDLQPTLPPPALPTIATSGDRDSTSANTTAQNLPSDDTVPAAAAIQGDGAPTPTEMGTQTQSGNGNHSTPGMPRAKFIQTLQSKSAWDALIHGSFS